MAKENLEQKVKYGLGGFVAHYGTAGAAMYYLNDWWASLGFTKYIAGALGLYSSLPYVALGVSVIPSLIIGRLAALVYTSFRDVFVKGYNKGIAAKEAKPG